MKSCERVGFVMVQRRAFSALRERVRWFKLRGEKKAYEDKNIINRSIIKKCQLGTKNMISYTIEWRKWIYMAGLD